MALWDKIYSRGLLFFSFLLPMFLFLGRETGRWMAKTKYYKTNTKKRFLHDYFGKTREFGGKWERRAPSPRIFMIYTTLFFFPAGEMAVQWTWVGLVGISGC